MFIISTALYSAITIVFVPALIVMIYMIVTNSRYSNVINVYGISTSGVGGLFTLGIIGYIFLTGLCVGELPAVWKNTLFLACLLASIAISVVMCKILCFLNRDRIKYANIVLADEEIQDKILECSKQLEEFSTTVTASAYNPGTREITMQRMTGLRETINKLNKIHQELQQQKIMMNAALGAGGLKNVSLCDEKAVEKVLDKQLDKFTAYRSLNSSFRDVEDIMKKYNI